MLDQSDSEHFNTPEGANTPESDQAPINSPNAGEVIQAAAQRLARMAPTTNYDAAHADDESEHAMEKAVNALKNKVWNEQDLAFYFSQVEIKMKSAGVKSNFTKLQVLSTILPQKVEDTIKNLLKKQESEFTNKDGYLQAKKKIIRIFGPHESADFERAFNRVLTGKPSQLANDLIDDLCDKELKNCCCLKTVGGLWRRAMPSSVRQAVAHYDFTRQNLENILQVADDVYTSSRPASAQVAAIAAPVQTTATPPQDPPEVLNQAFSQAFSLPPEHIAATTQIAQQAVAAQIAAIYQTGRGRGRGRGGRGSGRGNNRGGRGGATGSAPPYSATNPRHRTPRHPDLPPFGVCKRHWQFGKSSFTCLEPYTCEWKKFIQPKPQN